MTRGEELLEDIVKDTYDAVSFHTWDDLWVRAKEYAEQKIAQLSQGDYNTIAEDFNMEGIFDEIADRCEENYKEDAETEWENHRDEISAAKRYR